MRKLCSMLLKVLGVTTLDRVGGLHVQSLSFQRRHVSEQRLADQLVTEGQSAIALDRRDEPSLFGFLQGVAESLHVHAGHISNEIRGEHTAGYSCGNQRLTSEGRQPREPSPDDEPDTFGHRRLINLEVWSQPPVLIKQHTGLSQ